MLDWQWVNAFVEWSHIYSINLIGSGLVLLVYALATRIVLPKIKRSVDKTKLKPEAKAKANHTVHIFSSIVTIAVLLIIWGIDFSGLLVLSTSILTLTGVALFASWSLLSNITAYFLILFHNSFRRGNFVRIMDADNYIEGFISEINVFNTTLITEEREVVIYPNNLILTRPTMINPKMRLNGIGKVQEKSQKQDECKEKESG
jgi:small-conductance mechanosensitive channel